MARPKKTGEKQASLEETLQMLNKKYSSGNLEERFFVSTGSIALDKALGGGVMSGRITELIAWEGAGKTTVALHTVANAQKQGLKALYIDSEHALDKTYSKALNVNWEDMILIQPSFGEEAFDSAEELIKTGEVDLVIFDSTSGMIPKSQFEGDAGSSYIGKHAMLFSKEVPKLNILISKFNVACIFISQVREKIGVLWGSPETTQAGNTLKFFASNRIDLRKQFIKEGDTVVGSNTKFKVLKCKNASPYSTGILPIRFGIGIDKYEELITLAIETEVIKKWGKTITVFATEEGQEDEKYDEAEFMKLLKDNVEFFEEIKTRVEQKYSPSIEAE